MDAFEIKIVKFLNRMGDRRFDRVLGFLDSVPFLAFFWTLVVSVAVWTHPNIIIPFTLSVVIVAIAHFAITEGIIKHLLTRFLSKRTRPYISFPNLVKPIGKKFSDASFPSSHMATTVAMLIVVVSFFPSLFFASLVMVVGMSFSRLHSAMHYPTDVLAGIGLGFGYGYFALRLMSYLL